MPTALLTLSLAPPTPATPRTTAPPHTGLLALQLQAWKSGMAVVGILYSADPSAVPLDKVLAM
jgi:hypothetical protein